MKQKKLSSARTKAHNKANRMMTSLFKKKKRLGISDSVLGSRTGINRTTIFVLRKRYEKGDVKKSINMTTYYFLLHGLETNKVERSDIEQKVTNMVKELFAKKKEIGLSDRELAKKTGVVRSYICSLRNRLNKGGNASGTSLSTYYALMSVVDKLSKNQNNEQEK